MTKPASTEPSTYCLLGNIEFDLASSFSSFSHSSKVLLPEHETILRKPKVQFTGRSLDTLDLNFRWSASWTDPDARLKELREAMDLAEPMRLVFGGNTFKGLWLIESIDSELIHTSPTGEIMSLEVGAKLKEAGRQPKKRKSGGAATRSTTTGLAAFARSL